MIWHGTSSDELRDLLPFKDELITEMSVNSDFIIFCDPFPDWITQIPYTSEITLSHFRNHYNEIIKNTNLSNSILLLPKFTKILKYTFSLQKLITSLGQEDMINVIHFPYISESILDLKAGLYLVLNGYFKQAQVLLRSSIECAVAHYYYSSQKKNYDELAAQENFRLPSFRSGDRNMLSFLLNGNYIDTNTYHMLNLCYGTLNKYVHSNITSLTQGVLWETDKAEDKLELWIENACHVSHSLLIMILSMLTNYI